MVLRKNAWVGAAGKSREKDMEKDMGKAL